MSWLWGASTNPQYEELVEQACSPMKLQFPQGEDIAVNLEITDMIRSKAVQPKPAMQALKKRIASKNGRVQMYALSLTDTCIKNGGDHFLAEIASKEFVDEMSGLIRSPSTNPEVRTMALRLFQQWALAFQSKRELAFLVDVYNELKNSGIKFPPPPVGSSSHMLETATAPAWVDSEFCMRCRTAFTFTNRKHHCRSCGLIFDQACSSRVMPLPKFGIKEEVRVCEGCWHKAEKNKPTPAVPGRTPRSRRDFDADLQRAIELSLAQAQPGAAPSEPPVAYSTNANPQDDDEQLRLAIEASLRDMEKARPSAPSEEPEYKPLPTFDLNPRETETVLTFTNTIDQMAAYGERDLRRFPQVHMLAGQAHAVGGKLQRNSEEKTTKTQMLMEMQGKLNEAVTLYGQILNGQAAYAARKAQEAQQQQYAQQWAQPYAPYPQQPYANGYHAPQQYAPAEHQHQQQQYAPPQHQSYQQPQPQSPQAQAQPYAPSMYPSMPTYGYQPQQPYAYQPWQAQAQQQPHQPQASSRQNSYASPVPAHLSAASPVPVASAPASSSAPTVVSEPHSYAAAPEPQLPSAPPTAASATPAASGPPPIDLSSHPSMSPRSAAAPLSYGSAPSAPSAPARSASYTSPVMASAPLASPKAELSAPPSAPPQATSPVSAPSAPNPWENAYSAPVQPQQPQPYPASMFPSVPTGFADQPIAKAPSPKREEALLIEL